MYPQPLTFSFSQNITIQNSPGFVRRDDPSYNSIPPASGKPPGPIEPSGEIKKFISYTEPFTNFTFQKSPNGSTSPLHKSRTHQKKEKYRCSVQESLIAERCSMAGPSFV